MIRRAQHSTPTQKDAPHFMVLNWIKRYSSGIGGIAGASNHDALLFLLYNALFHIGLLGIYDVVLNFYFVSLGHSPQTIGLLQSLPRVAGLLTSIPVGLLANRFGTHRMILFATVGVATSLSLMAFVPTLPVMALSTLLTGLFYGMQQIALAPLMVTLVGVHARVRFFALHNVVTMLAMALGSFIGGYTPALVVHLFARIAPAASVANAQTPFAYGSAIFAAALVTLIGVVPFYLVRAGSAVSRHRVEKTDAGTVIQRVPWKRLTYLSLPMITFGFTGGLTFPFYNLFFRTTFHVTDETVGTILSIGWIGMALIPMLNPWWEKQFGRVYALGLTLTCAAVAFFALSIAPTLALSVVAFTLAISFRNTMQPLYQPLLLDQLPDDLHNIISSLTIVLWNVGWFAATTVSGFWQQSYGFGVIMKIVAAGVLVTGASVMFIFRHQRFGMPSTAAVPVIENEHA